MRDSDAALDIVQDAMMKLSEKYGDRPAAELPLLFTRILQNATYDFFRRQKVRSTWVTLFSALSPGHEDDNTDPLETLEAMPGSPAAESAEDQVERSQVVAIIEEEVATFADPSTRGIFDALLGRYGRGGNRRSYGMLARQRQDPLFARNARAGEGLESTGNTAMNEKEFGYQIRQALNEAASGLDYKTTYRLEQARAAALARHREPATAPAWSPALQAAGGRSSDGLSPRLVRKFGDGRAGGRSGYRLRCDLPVAATAGSGTHFRSGRYGFCSADG